MTKVASNIRLSALSWLPHMSRESQIFSNHHLISPKKSIWASGLQPKYFLASYSNQLNESAAYAGSNTSPVSSLHHILFKRHTFQVQKHSWSDTPMAITLHLNDIKSLLACDISTRGNHVHAIHTTNSLKWMNYPVRCMQHTEYTLHPCKEMGNYCTHRIILVHDTAAK